MATPPSTHTPPIDPTAPDGTASGPDATNGKLFEVPRATINVDTADPDDIQITFGGQVKLARGIQIDADLFNSLVPGNDVHLEINAHVGGTNLVHHTDKDGDVDKVIASRKLVIHSITIVE